MLKILSIVSTQGSLALCSLVLSPKTSCFFLTLKSLILYKNINNIIPKVNANKNPTKTPNV